MPDERQPRCQKERVGTTYIVDVHININNINSNLLCGSIAEVKSNSFLVVVTYWPCYDTWSNLPLVLADVCPDGKGILIATIDLISRSIRHQMKIQKQIGSIILNYSTLCVRHGNCDFVTFSTQRWQLKLKLANVTKHGIFSLLLCS